LFRFYFAFALFRATTVYFSILFLSIFGRRKCYW